MKQEIFGSVRLCTLMTYALSQECPDIYKKLADKYNLKSEYDECKILEQEVTDLGISDNFVVNSECYFNDKLKDTLISLVENFPHYLGVSDSRTWAEHHGYIFSDDVTDIIKYDHDLKLLMEKHFPNKAILLDGYHDNHKYNQPIYIIGLTNEEYESLKNKDLKHLIEFAESLF